MIVEGMLSLCCAAEIERGYFTGEYMDACKECGTSFPVGFNQREAFPKIGLSPPETLLSARMCECEIRSGMTGNMAPPGCDPWFVCHDCRGAFEVHEAGP